MTAYTMADIKNHVIALGRKAQEEYTVKLNQEFENHLESNPEITLDISQYEDACQRAERLHKKYTGNAGYYHRYSCDLKYIIQKGYFETNKDMIQKIQSQFTAILDKLKTIRNPNKAIEFLKLCGIELSEKEQFQEDIPVDPDFIRSILPAARQLTDGQAK